MICILFYLIFMLTQLSLITFLSLYKYVLFQNIVENGNNSYQINLLICIAYDIQLFLFNERYFICKFFKFSNLKQGCVTQGLLLMEVDVINLFEHFKKIVCVPIILDFIRSDGVINFFISIYR